MFKRESKYGTSFCIAALAALLVGSAIGQDGSRAAVQTPVQQLTSVRTADLERAFWVCEYAATTRANADIATCAAVYEAVKQRKFGGDFEALLTWWQQNKAAEIQRIASDNP